MATKVKVANKKKEEQKKSQTILLISFFILIGVAGVLFYFLYLKPPVKKEGTTPTTNIMNTVLKDYSIDDLKEDIEKRKLVIPSIETKSEEIGKEDPFTP
ncbi:MAG TPA: hypothetical protein P5272_00270 [Caldisericia bacterium]|nr:hypothetical protein [Caldisericia bacterium]HOL83138.1 hypothetical protein [Caldisericia bacterium]HPC56856.1 hypothetical protein [Caldisericia bacterium]HPP43506.1 hypothetical protein [Caldisericia bacterium]HRT37113.1 hypothetical protein [Caldisericia bacterium]